MAGKLGGQTKSLFLEIHRLKAFMEKADHVPQLIDCIRKYGNLKIKKIKIKNIFSKNAVN